MDEPLHDKLAEALLGRPYDELTPLQCSVIDLIATRSPSGLNPALEMDDRTFGQKLADQVAAVGGSWAFIIGFGVCLMLWIAWNVLGRGLHLDFDPYPFIFLNLMLSMLAAIQAPVIMMSQNRQSVHDRQAAEFDYLVNMRAELEIMHLHDKVDALRDKQFMELMSRQEEMLELLRGEVAALKSK